MPTLLLDSCATQRPSSDASARDSSRSEFRSFSAACSASGAGPGADADALEVPGSSVLPPAPGVPAEALPAEALPADALPAVAGASLAVAAVSVGVVDSRCQTNQPAPPTARS